MAMQIDLTLISHGGRSEMTVAVQSLIIAGWTGRDRAAIEDRIRELEALGLRRPATTPIFFRLAARRLTTAPVIECSGTASSGEAETVIIAANGQLFVGLGSDHTDREVEAYGVTVAKQVCDKPMAATVWPLSEVVGHWDRLILRSWLTEGGVRRLYQEGSVAELLAPDELIAQYCGAALPDGTVMMGGTLFAIDGVRAGQRFECELVDHVLSRRIELAYDIVELPIAG